jgi:O-acetyl-ADP-ribose deacetylase (regulator of RNase III)
MTPIRVFICHKKKLEGGRPNEKAAILHHILAGDGGTFEPWFDEPGIPTGIVWEKEIYRHLLVTDVLLVLIGPGTAESQWVRREIAFATALGIAIVPIGFELEQADFEQQLRKLEIAHLQAKLTPNINLAKPQLLLTELRVDLVRAAERTQRDQKIALQDLNARRNAAPAKAADNPKAASFVLRGRDRNLTLHVASGHLDRVRDVDVLVNSENDYMQMARVFESRTVSSMLRRKGSRILRDGRYEDTIQQELDWQLRERSRPVHAAEVFATSAGGPSSELVTQNRARYIFHVAAVQAVVAEGVVVPFKQHHQIEACVRSCLTKLVEVNAAQGIVSPPDTDPRKLQEARAQAGTGLCRSILFPLFGTGQGGLAAREVIGPMTAGLKSYLADEAGTPEALALTDIHISAYRQQDVDEVLSALNSQT